VNSVHPIIADTRASRTNGRATCTITESVSDALRQCVDVAKHGAAAAGVDESRFRHWWNGERNPITDVASFIHALGSKALPLIVLFYALAQRKKLRDMADAQLCEAFWASFDAESDREAVERRAKESFGRTGDLRAIRHATRFEASEEMKLSALCDELLERGVDPRNGVVAK
jgi:hypothetical protein